jgi:prepilin-type N-terminal cleavage/methylation domain-containing protein
MRPRYSPAPVAATRRSATVSARRRLFVTASAFTMIELLTVIAIIAILAAIIFPVFATARESVRRGTCVSNMQKIYQAVKLYELDNRRYPDYLFGPALNTDGTIKTDNTPNAGLSMSQVASLLRTTNAQAGTPAANAQFAYRNSAFPEYINDLSVFKCPNNTDGNVGSPNSTAAALTTRFAKGTDPNNLTITEQQAFYRYDSYDANPAVNASTGVLDPTNFQARYARVWQTLLNRAQIDALTPTEQETYRNQLVFRDPSSDTYLTMCTYHAPKGKIIVLWLNGNAKVMDSRKLIPPSNVFAGTNGRDYDTYKMTPNNY